VSDHRPVSFHIKDANISCVSSDDMNHYNTDNKVPLWSNCDAATLACYASHLDKLLQDVAIPYNAVVNTSRDKAFLADIDIFYNDICKCVVKATADIIPLRNRPVSEFNVLG